MLKYLNVIILLVFLFVSCNEKPVKNTRIQAKPIFDNGFDALYDDAKNLLKTRAENLLKDYNCKYNIKDNGTSFLIEIEEGCRTKEDFINVLNTKGRGKLQFYISSSNESTKELIRSSGYIEPCNITSIQEIPFSIGCLPDNYNAEEFTLKIQDSFKLVKEKIITQHMFDEQQLWLIEKQTFEALGNDDILGTEEKEENKLLVRISPQGVDLLNKLIAGKEGENLVITIDDTAIHYFPITKGMKFYEETVMDNLHPSALSDLNAGLLSAYFPYYFEVKMLN